MKLRHVIMKVFAEPEKCTNDQIMDIMALMSILNKSYKENKYMADDHFKYILRSFGDMAWKEFQNEKKK